MPEGSDHVGKAAGMMAAASSIDRGLAPVVVRRWFEPGRLQGCPLVSPFSVKEETPLEDFFRRVARFGRIPELVP
jgi:hypothetical protein